MNTLDIALCYAKKAEQAKSRGKEFAMSFTYFANLKAQTHCSYSGAELKVTGPNGFSFERLNNDIGYVDGNVIVVTQELNKVRSDLNTTEDVLARIETHKESIKSRMNAVNSCKAKIGCLKKRIEDFVEEPRYEFKEKLVIPAWGHAQWRKAHDHALGVQHDINHVKASIEDNKALIIKWETKASKHSKSKIRNITATIEAQKSRLETLEKVSHNYDGFIGRLQKRLCKVRIVDSKVVEWTTDLKATTAALEGTLKNIEAINVTISKLEIVAEGLKKFENLSKMDKYRVELGLALDAPMTKVLKQKMAYNLTDRV